MKRWILALLGLAAALGIGFAWIASQPNRDIEFEREVTSISGPATLNREFNQIQHWPDWHFAADRVNLLDVQGHEVISVNPSLDPILKSGEKLRFKIEPKGKPWKRYELDVEVMEFVPGRLVRLHLLRDSTERILQMFDRLDWQIEILAGGKIKGSVSGHTRSWRARLFGTLAPRTMMNQVFYPDLLKLAGMKETYTVEMVPH